MSIIRDMRLERLRGWSGLARVAIELSTMGLVVTCALCPPFGIHADEH
jgi:hypothetical protein